MRHDDIRHKGLQTLKRLARVFVDIHDDMGRGQITYAIKLDVLGPTDFL